MRTKIYFLRGENHFVVYVGKTINILENRLRNHLNEARRGHMCRRCYGIRAMLRQGFTPTITLQTEVEGNGAKAEQAYIKWLRSKGVDLWNTTDGGEGTPGRVCSIETKKKTSKSLMGHPGWMKGKTGIYHRSKETRIKIGLAGRGRVPWNKGLKGVQPSTRKGKTYTEIYGENRAKEEREKRKPKQQRR
jgi:hypothetical protein